MYRRIAERLVDYYPYDWKENLRMKETCICGVEIVCSTLINIIILIALACLLSKQGACLIFFMINGMTRLFSGGVHAKNHRSCILFYIAVLLASVYAADYLDEIRYGMYVLCMIVPVVSISVNFKYGGMQKQLEEGERRKYKKICKYFIVMYNIILYVACGIEVMSGIPMGVDVRNSLYVGCFALLTQSISLFLGRKNCINYRNEEVIVS